MKIIAEDVTNGAHERGDGTDNTNNADNGNINADKPGGAGATLDASSSSVSNAVINDCESYGNVRQGSVLDGPHWQCGS